MLVLKLSVGRRVVIGDAVLEVLEVRGHECRLGFSAPRDVLICREEVLHDRQEIVPLKQYMPRRKAG